MDETTQQMIDDFRSRMEERTREYQQQLVSLSAEVLSRQLEELNRPPPPPLPPLPKRMLQGIGRVRQWLGRKLVDHFESRGGQPAEPPPEEDTPVIIDANWRALSPHQEKEE